jgi:undecaprenyl-diphosphatase
MGLTGQRAVETFEVVIQLGSILAVVVLYWPRFRGLLSLKAKRSFSGLRGLSLLFVTCFPAALLGLFFHSRIKEDLFNPAAVAMALFAGALLMLALEKFRPRPRYFTLDEMNFKTALGIGLCQCCSLWPGFSRSASTIMGGMLLGAERKLAAEYSFIAAAPIMCAAASYDLYKSWEFLSGDYLAFFVVGFVVSFFSAWAAIKVFIGLVGRAGLVPFALYRLCLAPFVYWFMVN